MILYMSDQPGQDKERNDLWAFVDESSRDDLFYFMGAVIGDSDSVSNLEAAMARIVEKHKPSHPFLSGGFEIHASAMMNGKKGWEDVSKRLRYAIIGDVCRAIGDSNVRIYIEGIDIVKHRAKEDTVAFEPRELSFQWLLEELDEHATTEDAFVTVCADNHHTAPQAAVKIGEYRTWGTEGYRTSKLERICDPVAFEDSKDELMLQAADVVSYIFNRLTTVSESNPKADELKRSYWKEISRSVVQTQVRS